MDEREDDDIFKYDQDPDGWTLFFNAADPKQEYGLPITQKVSFSMPKDSEVQF
jgi:hypothetical protein